MIPASSSYLLEKVKFLVKNEEKLFDPKIITFDYKMEKHKVFEKIKIFYQTLSLSRAQQIQYLRVIIFILVKWFCAHDLARKITYA